MRNCGLRIADCGLKLCTMTDEVRKHKDAVPFVPFWIKTSDGKQYRVKHPDYLAFSPKGGRIVVFADEEATTTLSALHIVAVEPQRARSRGRHAG